MDLRALRYFVTAVDQGSISAAALACHIAQPSITQAITKLEGKFNCQLLERHHKGVSPTKKGLELYHLAVDLLQHANAIEAQLNANNTPTTVSISLDRSIQVSYIEQIIQASKTLNLSINFELMSDQESADMILTTYQNKPKRGVFFPIAIERYALLIPLDNELAYKQDVSITDLDGQAIIERRYCENNALFEKVQSSLGIKLPVAAHVDNEEWAISLVAAGLGLSISPVNQNFTDPRFKIRPLKDFINIQTPDRQIGIFFSHNTSSEKQECIDQISRYFTSAETLSPLENK